MQVFEDCSNLKSITLGSSLKDIDSWAFKNCNALTSITILATTPPRIAGGSFPIYGTLHVLPGCKAAYEEHFEWKKFNIVEDATTGIFNINAETAKKDGKYLVDGNIVIVKNGKTYQANGASNK